MCWMIIILYQWDFCEQIKKLVRLLLYTNEDCSRKFHAWSTFCNQSVHEGLIYNRLECVHYWSHFWTVLTWWYVLEPHWGFLYFHKGLRLKYLNPIWYQSLLNYSLDHKWQAQMFCVSELILHLTVLICRENCNVSASAD